MLVGVVVVRAESGALCGDVQERFLLEARAHFPTPRAPSSLGGHTREREKAAGKWCMVLVPLRQRSRYLSTLAPPLGVLAVAPVPRSFELFLLRRRRVIRQ